MAAEDAIRFACEGCRARLKAPAAAVGRTLTCPKCGVKGTVPSRQSQFSLETPISAAAVNYQDHDDGLIAVECKLCRTRMYAEPDEVGTEKECPDCGTLNLVRPAPVKPQTKKTVPREGYALGKQPKVEHPRPLSEETACACPSCGEQYQFPVSLLGESFECARCTVPFLIADGTGGYASRGGFQAADENLSVAKNADVSYSEKFNHALEEGRRKGLWEEEKIHIPPKYPFLSRVYGFLWYPETMQRWSVTGAFLTAFFFMASSALIYAIHLQPGGVLDSAGGAILAVFFSLMAFGLGAAALFHGSCNACSIIADTANGVDDIESWPTGAFLDWLWEGWMVLNGVLLGVTMAGGAAMLLQQVTPWPIEVCISASLPLALFGAPFFILSILDTGNPFVPFSSTLLQSCISSMGSWIKFIITSTPAAIVAASGLVGFSLPLWDKTGWWYAAQLFGGFIVAMAAYVYFRLVGRLGYVVLRKAADIDLQKREDAAAAAAQEESRKAAKQRVVHDEEIADEAGIYLA